MSSIFHTHKGTTDGNKSEPNRSANLPHAQGYGMFVKCFRPGRVNLPHAQRYDDQSRFLTSCAVINLPHAQGYDRTGFSHVPGIVNLPHAQGYDANRGTPIYNQSSTRTSVRRVQRDTRYPKWSIFHTHRGTTGFRHAEMRRNVNPPHAQGYDRVSQAVSKSGSQSSTRTRVRLGVEAWTTATQQIFHTHKGTTPRYRLASSPYANLPHAQGYDR